MNRKKCIITCAILMTAGTMLTGCAGSTARMLFYGWVRYHENFTYLGVRNGQLGNEYSEIAVASKKFPGEEIRFFWGRYEDGSETYQDNYLGYLLREQIEERVLQLAEQVYGTCTVYYDVGGPIKGIDYPVQMSVEEFCADGRNGISLWIGVCGQVKYEQEAKQMAEFLDLLRKHEIWAKGTTVYVGEEERSEERRVERV